MAIIPKGSEPLNIKKRMDTLFEKLDGAYPDKVICGLQKDHKKWSETVREFSKALGYPDSESFLNAYGYTVKRKDSGRPKTNNYDEVIEELRKRYPDGMPFSKISEIIAANPDLKGVLKTMQNNANALFGMSVKDYFNQIGLFGLRDKKSLLDDLIDRLKLRYRKSAQKPNTLAKLSEENQDLPLDRLAYIKEIYGSDVEPFLLVIGVIGTGYEKAAPTAAKRSTLRVSGDTEEERNEAYLRLLAQRYDGKNNLPATLTALAAENRDIPINKLNKYIRSQGEKKIERYYIRNRIMQGKDTDLKEYTYCMVSLEKTAWDVGSKQYAYLTGENEYAPGDMVVVEFGFAGWEIGEVVEVIYCLGIDAPWPVSKTKEILRKARPEEISKGVPILSAEEQVKSRQRFASKGTPKAPETDWADAFSEQNEIPDGTITGFVLANQEQFRCESKVDLREQVKVFSGTFWVPCEFRFRGYAAEVAKLKRYAKQNGIHISWDGTVSEDIREIRVIAEDKTMDLIEKFPALKATGLAEEWWQQEIHVIYSESGYAGITHMEFGGYFDKRHEGGDGRWEWEYDMMEPVAVSFTWLQTGDEEYVSYRYPFTAQWNRNQYVREQDGVIFVPFSKDQPEYRITDGMLEEYLGSSGDMIIPETATAIRTSFCGDSRITSVYIPGTVSCIPSDTFKNCTNLRKVTIGEGVERIECSAFEGCTALSEVILPDSLVMIGDHAFGGCCNLDVGRLCIPSSVRFEAMYPFFGCGNQPDVLYTSDKKRLLRYVSCEDASFTVPDSVQEIGKFAFCAHKELTTVMLPSGLKKIGEMAFSICVNLADIFIPESVEEIGMGAFRSCNSLKSIRIPGSVRTVSDNLLCDCEALEEVILEEGITQIGTDAFTGCSRIRRAYLPASVQENICDNLFANSKKLIIYGKAGSVAEVYATEKGIVFQNSEIGG